MRHPSKNRSLFASLVLCGPLLAVGCTNSDSIGSGGDRDGGSSGRTVLCETLSCFSACQKQIAMAPIDQPVGFVPAPAPSHAYETFPLGSDMVLATGRSFAEIRKWSDLSLLGSVPLPATWGYESTAVVGNTAFVRDGYLNLAVLDLTNPAAPRATAWLPSAGSPVGSWRGKLVLDTGYGVSFLDVSNPLAPVESFCLPNIGAELISGDTIVSSSANVYRLDPTTNTAAPWASIPLGDTRVYAMDGLRLVVPAAGGSGWDVGLYDLGGTAPVEVARHEQLYHPYLWSNSGFFYEAESQDLSKTIAYDMRGAFEPYSVSQVAGSECLTRLDALDGSAAFVVSAWLPGTRFSPDSLPPVHCPVEDTANDTATAGALSPDGHTLLLPGAKGWVFRDLDTGTDTIKGSGPVGYAGSVGWVGDRIVAIETQLAVEFKSSSATILDAGNPQGALATVGLNPYAEWLGASGGQLIGFAPAPGFQSATSPTLSLLDPHAATVVSKPLGLPTDTSYTGYLWNDKLVVFDSAEAIVFNLDGSEQGRIALPSFIAAAKTFLLTDLGWFATTDAGEILRFDPTSSTVEVGVTSCDQCWLLGADGERVYVGARGPDALGPLAPPPGSAWEAYRNYSYLTYTELRAYAVTKGSYPLVGRYPLTETSMGWRLLIGSKLALVSDGALILTAPP